MQKNNIINSLDNNKIKKLLKIRDNKKYREEYKLFFLEGERLINDSPKHLLDSIFISEDYNKDISQYNDVDMYYVSNKIYNKIKNTQTSQGIIALAKIGRDNDYIECLDANTKNIVLLDNIQDPGNLGTIFRTCEASNITNVFLTKDCCDFYNPKVLRASMSSIFRINIYIISDINKFIVDAKNRDYKLITTTLDNDNNYYNYNFTNSKNIIIFGNEANGIKKDIIKLCDEKIKIPMNGSIESLNVSISCALILYEIKRQLNTNYEK